MFTTPMQYLPRVKYGSCLTLDALIQFIQLDSLFVSDSSDSTPYHPLNPYRNSSTRPQRTSQAVKHTKSGERPMFMRIYKK
jgi:hypothetical protein